MQILLASGNSKKVIEFRAVLEPLGVSLLLPAEVGGLPEVDEDRPSFLENARKKALSAARASGERALADDSGLEVDALGGAPGVHSARFAGKHGDDQANNRLLLERLQGIPPEERGARFVCALVLASPAGEVQFETLGYAGGRILSQARGTRDFGYDPLFEFAETGQPYCGRGFAELDAQQKAEVSHRGRALARLAEHLAQQALPAEGS